MAAEPKRSEYMRIAVDGHDVFVATGGKVFDRAKPTIVFIHGAGCDRTAWVLPARWFAHHGWSVLAPDLPGHGLSSGPALTSIAALSAWITHLLDAAGVAKAVLVGHSMGGAIAIETAAHHGPRIVGLGLVGTAAAIPVSPALLETAQKSPETAYDMMTAWSLGAGAKRGGNPVPGMWMTGGVRRVFGTNPADSLGIDLAACTVWSTGAESAGRIACPTTVVTGAQDVMTAAKRGAELARLIPGARLVNLERTGHMIPLEAPDAFLDALIAAFEPIRAAA